MLTKSLFLTLLAFTLPFESLALRVPSAVLQKRQANDNLPQNSTAGPPPPGPPNGFRNFTRPLKHPRPTNRTQSGLPTPPPVTPATVAPIDQTPADTNYTTPTNATSILNDTTISAVTTDGIIATAWYPSWLASQMPIESIPWSKYNTLTFAFATTTPDPSVIDLDSTSQELLPKFTEQAKQHNVKSLLSIGGWTGSIYFSPAVATADARAKFIKALLDLVQTYGLDGLDFDWEFPNKQALGCNIIAPEDTANFLIFLKELRADPVGRDLILSAAVAVNPWAGPDGTPSKDLSEFANVLDFIAIMAYDVTGAWSPAVGPNAPLKDSCAPALTGSVDSAVKLWLAAGIPANQLVVGVASYGRAYTVQPAEAVKIGNSPAFTGIPLGEGEPAELVPDICGVIPATHSGLFNFNGLIDAGFLAADGTAAPGMKYKYDECSETPFLYDEARQMMISYDDAQSFAAKGTYIVNNGVKGFAMWHTSGDSNDILLDSINKAVGRA